jgi:hypothetical protein
MKVRSITFEDVFYLIIFVAGLVLRFANLGALSLSDYEASRALQALSIARGAPVLSGSQTLYVNGTALLFMLFNSSEWIARFLPALIGSLIVLPVYLLRDRIGRIPALLLAGFLVIDPILWALSRQADSLGMAVVFTLLGMAFLVNRKPLALGITTGLALLSGSQVWLGVLSLAAAALLARFFLVEDRNEDEETASPPGFWETLSGFIKKEKFKILIPAVVTLLLGGTLFMLVPAGFSTTFSSPVVALQSWLNRPGGNGASLVGNLPGLLVYNPMVLFLGVIGSLWVIFRRDKLGLFLCFWWAAAFILALVSPSGRINDLVWMFIPLWIIAARFITWMFSQIEVGERKWFGGFAVLSLVVMVFLCMAMVNVFINANNPSSAPEQNEFVKRIAVVFGGIILLLATTYLIGFGWSARLAFTQWLAGFSLLLLVVTFSSGWGAAGLSKAPTFEMLQWGAYPTSGRLLEQTIDAYSRMKTGATKLADVSIVGVDNSYLHWILRDQRDPQFLKSLSENNPGQNPPSMMITNIDFKPEGSTLYRGSSFTIGDEPAWSLMFSQEWLNWALFRKAPLNRQLVILWVRDDLFPGGGYLPDSIPNSGPATGNNGGQ